MCYLIVLKTRSHPLYHLLGTLLIKQNNQDGDNSHGFFLAGSEKYYIILYYMSPDQDGDNSHGGAKRFFFWL